MIKPKNVSWRDWWASRTNRFNTMVIGFNTSVTPVLLSVDEADLNALGVSSKWVVIIMLGVNILAALNNQRLRGKTDTALSGRSEVLERDLL